MAAARFLDCGLTGFPHFMLCSLEASHRVQPTLRVGGLRSKLLYLEQAKYTYLEFFCKKTSDRCAKGLSFPLFHFLSPKAKHGMLVHRNIQLQLCL